MAAGATNADPFVRYLQRGFSSPNPPDTQELSVTIYRLLDLGEPVTREQLGRASGFSPERIGQLLEDLLSPALELDVQGTVTAFGGLSLTPTQHRFIAGKVELYTWCVFDALFLPEILGKPAILSTHCPASGTKLTVELEPGRLQAATPSGAVMSIVAPGRQASWDNLRKAFCDQVNLFRDVQTFIAWSKGREDVECVTLEQAQQLARQRNALRLPDVEWRTRRA